MVKKKKNGLYLINIFYCIFNVLQIFFFELTDCYEKKNMPKVIYCLHGLR